VATRFPPTETYAARNAGTGLTLTPAGTVSGGNGIYTYTYNTVSTGVIYQKALTVSGITANSTVYDGTTTAKLGGSAAFHATEGAGAGTTSDGWPYSVDSVSPGTVTGTLAAKDVGSQAVTTAVTVTGTGNGNYTVTPQAGLTQQVNPLPVTLAGNPNKIYDGTTGIAGVDLKVSNAVGSDVVTVTGTGSSGDLAGSGFGVQTINSFTGLSLGGAQAANYTLTGASGSVVITAGDTECQDNTIANSNNGGTGFAAWTGVSIGSGGGIYNTATSPAGDLCGSAWGLYTGSGAVTTSVQRPLTNSDSLAVNQSVRVDMQNGGVQSGGSEGLSLYNAANNAVFELFFSGGATYWTINASSVSPASAIPYAGTTGGCRAIFTLTGSGTTYSLTVQVPIGGTNYGPYTGSLLNPTGGQSITQLRFYTYNIGGGNNLQFNDLAVGCPAFTITTQPSSTAACAGSTASFTAASTTASSPTFQWQVNTGSSWANVSTGTGGTMGTYTTAATTTGMNGYQYRCVVTDGCGIAVNSTVATLTVNAVPAQTITPAAPTVCASSTGNTASVSTTSGATYAWSISGGTITAGGSSSTVTYTAGTGSAVTLNCVVTSSALCASAGGQNASVTINSTPATPGTITQANPGGSSVCSGASGVTYTISAVSGATTYTWTVPTGASVTAGAGTTSITVNWGTATSGNVTVTAGNTCGTSAAASLAVTVISTPATPGTITQANPSGSSVCTNASGVTYSISAVSGATTYTWTVPSGASITVGAGTTSITVNWGTATSGNVTVTAGNTCGTSSASTLGVTVDLGPTGPTISIAPSSAVCAGSPATFSVSTVSGSPSGYAWRKRDTTLGWGTGNNWVFTYNSGGCDSYNGVFIGSATASGQSPGINNSGQAFGLYANTYNSAEAKRDFGSLSIGQNVSFDMQIPVTLTGNDGSGHNSQALFALRNSANEANPRLEIWVLAGASYVTISDGTGNESATVPYDSNGYHCVFQLTGQNTYNLTVKRLSNNNVYSYAGRLLKGTANDPVNQVRAWLKNYDSAGGAAEDFYLNNLVAGAYEDNASNYTAGGCASTTWTTSPNLGFGPVSSSASYVISSAATTDSGSYDVLVWDSCGQAFASPVTLTVNTIPDQTITPAASAVCAGSTGNTASVTITSGATYAWSITGGTITAGGSSSTVTYTTGTDSAVTLSCVVTSSAGCASAGGQSTSVTVNAIPDQTITPTASAVCAGSTGNTASVTITSGATYAWSITGGTITDGGTSSTVTYTAGTGSAVTLSCVVTSSAGCASAGGQGVSVTVNALPVAPSSDVSYNLSLPFSLKIKISDLLTNWTGTSLSVQSVANSADGGTVTKDSTYIFYTPPTGSPTSPDTIPYTVSGAGGCATAASIDVVFVGQPGGVAQQITVVGGVATVNFAGIPGYPYIVQRAEDVSFTVNLTTVLTTNAPADGLFTFEDSTSLSQAYYRLKYNP
jgi:hypothetical protein